MSIFGKWVLETFAIQTLANVSVHFPKIDSGHSSASFDGGPGGWPSLGHRQTGTVPT